MAHNAAAPGLATHAWHGVHEFHATPRGLGAWRAALGPGARAACAPGESATSRQGSGSAQGALPNAPQACSVLSEAAAWQTRHIGPFGLRLISKLTAGMFKAGARVRLTNQLRLGRILPHTVSNSYACPLQQDILRSPPVLWKSGVRVWHTGPPELETRPIKEHGIHDARCVRPNTPKSSLRTPQVSLKETRPPVGVNLPTCCLAILATRKRLKKRDVCGGNHIPKSTAPCVCWHSGHPLIRDARGAGGGAHHARLAPLAPTAW